MVEKGIWGGITQAVKRYAKANNKYTKDLYNPDELSIYLQYFDANNRYGWAIRSFKVYKHIDLIGRMEKTSSLKKQMNLSKKARKDIF